MARKRPSLAHLCRQQWSLETLPHVFVAVLGVFAGAAFGAACVQYYIFEAVLSAAIALLCGYAFTLQTRRFHLARCLGGLGSSSAIAQTKPQSLEPQVSDELHPAGSHRDSDQACGYSSSQGFLRQHAADFAMMLRGEVTVMGDVLVAALAKEHLRTMEALRRYEEACGPLQGGDAESVQLGTELRPTTPVAAMPSPAAGPLIDLDVLDAAPTSTLPTGHPDAAPTPRSPQGMPSPEQQRRSNRSKVGGSSFYNWPHADGPPRSSSNDSEGSRHGAAYFSDPEDGVLELPLDDGYEHHESNRAHTECMSSANDRGSPDIGDGPQFI